MRPPFLKGDFELQHGRIEQRGIRQLAVKPEQVSFPAIYQLIEVERNSVSKKYGKKQTGKRLFFSSIDQMLPAKALGAIRGRWNIENKNHHPRDATFLEDKSRAYTGNTAANMALLRGAVLTIWKITSPKLPATAFIQQSNRKIDKLICVLDKNQRLTNLQ